MILFRALAFISSFLVATKLLSVEAELVNCTDSPANLSCSPGGLYTFRHVHASLLPNKNGFDESKATAGGSWTCSFNINLFYSRINVHYVHFRQLGLKQEVVITVRREGFSMPAAFTVLGYPDDIKVVPGLGHKCEEFPELNDREKQQEKLSEQKAEASKNALGEEALLRGCDCSYHYKSLSTPGGCQISKPAAPGFACKCSYNLFWRCSGKVHHCTDNESPSCKAPSTDKDSCDQGDGDCKGY